MSLTDISLITDFNQLFREKPLFYSKTVFLQKKNKFRTDVILKNTALLPAKSQIKSQSVAELIWDKRSGKNHDQNSIFSISKIDFSQES